MKYALTILLLCGTTYASELGPDGRVQFASDALLTVDFEDPTTTIGVLQTLALTAMNAAYTDAPLTAATVAPFLVHAPDAIQGATSLHFTSANASGFAIVMPSVFAKVMSQRISVDFWGRAEGMEPLLAVTYGAAADLPATQNWGWARIPAVRTGRETSDGWVEYSTGAIDGSVLDRPIHDITITARVVTDADTTTLLNAASTYDTDAVTIDAVEMRPATGSIATGACTAANVDTACAGNECFYGRCVDGAVAWHVAPSLTMQQEITARVVSWIQNFLGDRHAFTTLDPTWSTTTNALASATATSRSFWGGLNAQMVAVRDSHTHFGAPYGGINTPFSVRPSAASGPLDVCFGPTLDDLGDGKLAYVVWKLGANPTAGIKVGDVVTAIDGTDPKTWAELVFARYAGSLPVDPDADWAPTARDLASLIATHASTLTLTRCSGGTCAAQAPIDIANASLSAIMGGNYAEGSLTCYPRFTDLVAGAQSDSSGGDLVLSAALDSQTVGVEFNGFEPTSETVWRSAVDAAFALPHAQMIFDAREGHGGLNALGDYMVEQLRSTTAPAVLMLASRGAFDDPDAALLTAFDWSVCSTMGSWQCSTADIFTYQPATASPPGIGSKVAWLNTDDISNNDMVPRVLQGRANLAIFGPIPSYGALGSDVAIPALQPDWRAGTIAASDGRYGTSIATAEATTTWQSGMGVVPDQIVTQTLSDVLAGTDTIVAAARAWVAK